MSNKSTRIVLFEKYSIRAIYYNALLQEIDNSTVFVLPKYPNHVFYIDSNVRIKFVIEDEKKLFVRLAVIKRIKRRFDIYPFLSIKMVKEIIKEEISLYLKKGRLEFITSLNYRFLSSMDDMEEEMYDFMDENKKLDYSDEPF